MALYHNLTDLLVRTDFTTTCPYRDAWVDPSGNITAGEAFNHLNMALDIIYKSDNARRHILDCLELEIDCLKKCGDPFRKIDNTIMTYNEIKNGLSCSETFSIYNKRHKLDECEFIAVVLGYVAIEAGHIIYNPAKVNSLQTHALGIGYELIDNNRKILIA